jgi:hypothetical protein
MSKQSEFDFFDDEQDDDVAPYQAHSKTSRAAAEAIEPDVASLRGKVLAFIRERGPWGATDEEIQLTLRMNPSTERPRRIELHYAGLVKLSGTTRPTASGRQAMVWIESSLPPQRERFLK